MELIEVKILIWAEKGKIYIPVIYVKCDVNFRDPQIQIHSSTFLHFYTYYTCVYPLFQMIVILF